MAARDRERYASLLRKERRDAVVMRKRTKLASADCPEDDARLKARLLELSKDFADDSLSPVSRNQDNTTNR